MVANGRVVVVDGYAHIYRSFYAIPELTNARGEPVNALFAISRFLMKLDQELPHEFGVIALDKGKCERRLSLLPTYKATRAPMPDALRQQIPVIREWMSAAGWVLLEEEGREADDLIAAVVAAREGHETFMISHDKDLAQLVARDVYLVLPAKKGESEHLNEDGVKAKYGVPPGAVVDFFALVGDSVDNIPGIDGIGRKTAADLLNRFGSIERLLADVDSIKREMLRQRLRDGAAQLYRNRELVTLDARRPQNWTGLDGLRRRAPDTDALLRLASDHGLKSVLATLEKARETERNPSLF